MSPARNPPKALVERGRSRRRAVERCAPGQARRHLRPRSRVIRYILAKRRDYSLSVPFEYEIAAPRPDPSVAVVCHMFHHELTPVLGGDFWKDPCSAVLSSPRPVLR